jgi:type II secretory pathway component PulF
MNRKPLHRGLSIFFERMPIQDRINFARHLSIVIKAGLPLVEGLKIIRSQATSKTLKEVLDHLTADVERGQSLADSLESHRHIFGDFFINIIRVGETSGTLSQNLVYLAEEMRKSKELQSKIKSAMVYPMVILFATIAIVSFLTFFVFPKIIPVFTGLKITLPASTRFLIGFLDVSKEYGIFFLIGFVVLIVAFKILIRLPFFKYIVHRAIFFVPVVSSLIVNINMANFSRIMGLLLKSGIRIVEAVTITSNTFENAVYKRILGKANDEIRRGEQLAHYLVEYEKFFPILLCGMIRIGENTGNLEDNLFYLSDYYLEEVDNKIKNLTNLLEPVMLLFMGLFVGFVAISIIMPIYSISQGLSN